MQGARLDAGRDNSHPPSSALIGSARKLWKIFATDRKILPTKKVRSRRERAGKCWRRAEPGCWQWSCNREKKKKREVRVGPLELPKLEGISVKIPAGSRIQTPGMEAGGWH